MAASGSNRCPRFKPRPLVSTVQYCIEQTRLNLDEMEEIELARIRRNRQMTVRELPDQHDAAVRSVLQCMDAAESTKPRGVGQSSDG